ncbi:MAG: Transcriptional regulator, MarR family [Actinomycetia bacterium]|nr:Transcriptional regulator, MarR family [Actinomycetes bacterium]
MAIVEGATETSGIGPSEESAERSVAGEVLRLFVGLMGSMKEHLAESADSLGLSAPMAQALMSMGAPCSQRELAGTLHYDASNVTGIVDRLEQGGLVERRVDPKDRRIRLVVITEAGIELRKTLIERVFASGQALAGLSPDEQVQLRDLLRKIATPVEFP